MITFETTVRVKRPIEEVFAFVANPRMFPRWNSAVQTKHRRRCRGCFAGAPISRAGRRLLLMSRHALLPSLCCSLSITMLVALVSSGIGQGELIPSLTLAPRLLDLFHAVCATVRLLERLASEANTSADYARYRGTPPTITLLS
jgi:hypothetical protein